MRPGSNAFDLAVARPLRAQGQLAHREDVDTLVAHSLTSEGHDASEDGTGRVTPLVTEDGDTCDWCGGTWGEPGHEDECFWPHTPQQAATLNGGHEAKHSYPGDGGTFNLVSRPAAVRRLTPIECCRLQGFPDSWLGGNEPPDSPKYSALGDAVTVPVLTWIGERLREAM